MNFNFLTWEFQAFQITSRSDSKYRYTCANEIRILTKNLYKQPANTMQT